MDLRLIQGGKQPVPPEDTASRRKQLRKIQFYAGLCFDRPQGPIPIHRLGPRTLWAASAAAAVSSLFSWAVETNWVLLCLMAAAYVVVSRYSTAPTSWGAVIDKRLADYDALDREAYKRLQSVTVVEGLTPWHLAEWFKSEYSALDAVDGIPPEAGRRSRFLSKKL